jgi:hypothetical protein
MPKKRTNAKRRATKHKARQQVIQSSFNRRTLGELPLNSSMVRGDIAPRAPKVMLHVHGINPWPNSIGQGCRGLRNYHRCSIYVCTCTQPT